MVGPGIVVGTPAAAPFRGGQGVQRQADLRPVPAEVLRRVEAVIIAGRIDDKSVEPALVELIFEEIFLERGRGEDDPALRAVGRARRGPDGDFGRRIDAEVAEERIALAAGHERHRRRLRGLGCDEDAFTLEGGVKDFEVPEVPRVWGDRGAAGRELDVRRLAGADTNPRIPQIHAPPQPGLSGPATDGHVDDDFPVGREFRVGRDLEPGRARKTPSRSNGAVPWALNGEDRPARVHVPGAVEDFPRPAAVERSTPTPPEPVLPSPVSKNGRLIGVAISREHGDRADVHGRRWTEVREGNPLRAVRVGREEIRGLPDAATGAAGEPGIAGRVGRVAGDGGEATRICGRVRRRRTDGRPLRTGRGVQRVLNEDAESRADAVRDHLTETVVRVGVGECQGVIVDRARSGPEILDFELPGPVMAEVRIREESRQGQLRIVRAGVEQGTGKLNGGVARGVVEERVDKVGFGDGGGVPTPEICKRVPSGAISVATRSGVFGYEMFNLI